MESIVKMSSQYSDNERKAIEQAKTCLICGEEKTSCEWVVNDENGCDTFCCSQCYVDKEQDETGYWGMRSCCQCDETNHNSLIMGSCFCGACANLCRDCAREDGDGEWHCMNC
jgi:hypothetical protein